MVLVQQWFPIVNSNRNFHFCKKGASILAIPTLSTAAMFVETITNATLMNR